MAYAKRRGAEPFSKDRGSSGFRASFPEDARRRRLHHRSRQEPALAKAGVEADARFDGLFVLRTNTKIAALQVLLPYRNLLAVEDAFK